MREGYFALRSAATCGRIAPSYGAFRNRRHRCSQRFRPQTFVSLSHPEASLPAYRAGCEGPTPPLPIFDQTSATCPGKPHRLELTKMKKILFGLLAALVIAIGGFFGYQYYVQQRVAQAIEATFEQIRSAGGKASHGKVAFDLLTRTVAIADIESQSA